jgi:hypothetical protein
MREEHSLQVSEMPRTGNYTNEILEAIIKPYKTESPEKL